MIKIFLLISLNLFAQTYLGLTGKIPICCGGDAGPYQGNGGDATGFGCGGGSSGWAGANGGDGLYGGGGGGAGGNLYNNGLGGRGGSGAIVIAYYNANNSFMWSEIRINNFSNLAVPTGTSSMKVWAVGGGGGGGTNANLNDNVATSGGGAGSVAYNLFQGITAGQTMSGSIGAGGNRGGNASNGGAGVNTIFTWIPSGFQMQGTGGPAGLYNNGGTISSPECNPTPFNGLACGYGGGTFGASGDTQGSPGGAIGREKYFDPSDGTNPNGQKGNDSVNVGGDLFLAVTLARQII